MSNLGYLSEKREAQLAKILDASVNFDELLKNKKKFLGVINIGSVLERNDRKIFKLLIVYLDDSVIGVKVNSEKSVALEVAIEFLEKGDIQGFANHVAGILSGEIDIPYIDFDKQIYLSVLMLFNGIIWKAIIKVEKLIAEADAEA